MFWLNRLKVRWVVILALIGIVLGNIEVLNSPISIVLMPNNAEYSIAFFMDTINDNFLRHFSGMI